MITPLKMRRQEWVTSLIRWRLKYKHHDVALIGLLGAQKYRECMVLAAWYDSICGHIQIVRPDQSLVEGHRLEEMDKWIRLQAATIEQ